MTIKIPLTTQKPELDDKTAVFSGTKVPVNTLYEYMREGKDIQAFLSDYPNVERTQAELFLQLKEEVAKIQQEE